MATREEVKEAILRVAGNPVAGVIADLADEMADAVVALDAHAETPKRVTAVKGSLQQREKETRVIEAAEQR
jgi:CO/xanthine dehydrogenase FAD-binding subunit